MPVVSHHTLNGRISATTSPGLGRTALLPDGLGSAVRTSVNGTGSGRTARYSAHGSVAYATTGWNLPRNAWAGAHGYRSTQTRHAEQYVRARHYGAAEGRWTTVDPLWPYESAYGYAKGSPATMVDPSGTQVGRHCLLFCNIYPGGPCAWAKNSGLIGDKLAGVVCCGGEKTVCVWGMPPGTSRPGVAECLKEHERDHLPNGDCTSDGLLGPRPGGDLDKQECHAFAVEIACYVRKRKKECPMLYGPAKTRCEEEYMGAICDACGNAKLNFGCSPHIACQYC